MIPGNEAASRNRSFYDGLWSAARLANPASFNTWPLVRALLPEASQRLEIGPGLRPRLPLQGSHFLDLSPPVVQSLEAAGGLARAGTITSLPFAGGRFDLVCAFDVLEHVEDDLLALSELSRVVKPGGVVVFSVPLHSRLWTAFDDFVGHVRRYEPDQLLRMLDSHHLVLEKTAHYGMQPGNSRLLEAGIWLLTHQRTPAMFCYNWLLLPVRLRFQKRLVFVPGMLDAPSAAEIVVVCRRG